MRRLTILAVLLLAGTAWGGGPYYVDAAVLDDTDTGLVNHPWKTVNHAIAYASGNSTIYVKAGNYPETGTNYVLLDSNANDKNLTLIGYSTVTTDGDALALAGTWASLPTFTTSNTGRIVYADQANAANIYEFRNFNFTNATVTGSLFDLRNQGTVKLTRCKLLGAGAGRNILFNSAATVAGLELDHTTLGNTSNNAIDHTSGKVGTVTITDSTISETTALGIKLTDFVALNITRSTISGTGCVDVAKGTQAGNVTVSGGAWTSTGGAGLNISMLKMNTAGAVSLSGAITPLTLTWLGSVPGVRIQGASTSLSLNGCTLAGATTDSGQLFDKVGSAPLTAYLPVTITNCTGTCAGITQDIEASANGSYIGPFFCTGNVLTLTATGGGANRGFCCGLEVSAAGCQTSTGNAHPWMNAVVANNTFIYTAADATHLMYMGLGCDGFVVLNNEFRSTTSTVADGVILKNNYALVAYNRINHRAYGLKISGGKGNHIIGNTIISRSSNPALDIDTNQDWADCTSPATGAYGAPIGNVILNNICYGPSGVESLGYDYTGDNNAGGTASGNTLQWNNFLDYNDYYTIGGTAPMQVFNHSITTGANATYGWQGSTNTFAGVSYYNDLHSVYGNPNLQSPNTGLYAAGGADVRKGVPTNGTIGAVPLSGSGTSASTGTFGPGRRR